MLTLLFILEKGSAGKCKSNENDQNRQKIGQERVRLAHGSVAKKLCLFLFVIIAATEASSVKISTVLSLFMKYSLVTDSRTEGRSLSNRALFNVLEAKRKSKRYKIYLQKTVLFIVVVLR